MNFDIGFYQANYGCYICFDFNVINTIIVRELSDILRAFILEKWFHYQDKLLIELFTIYFLTIL